MLSNFRKKGHLRFCWLVGDHLAMSDTMNESVEQRRVAGSVVLKVNVSFTATL